MGAFFFGYTIVVILACFAAATFSVAAYAVSRRRPLLPQATFFACYIFEMASILGTEYVSQNLPFSTASYYEVTMPALRVTTSAVTLQCLWLMLLDLLDVHDRRVELAPTGIFVAACVVVLACLPYGAWRQWSFYTLRQAYVAFGLAFAGWRWRRSTDEHYRERLGRYRREYLLLWVLLVLIVLEDSCVILVAPIPSDAAGWLPLYLSGRNFCENVMMLFVATLAIRSSLETLSLRFAEPPIATADKADDVARHIAEQLPAYADAHRLSPREREVLSYLLEGLDNRRIAQELILSEGTIKTHVHNIMKKTGTASRDELRRDFWKS